jgi:YD repeat-containing protein
VALLAYAAIGAGCSSRPRSPNPSSPMGPSGSGGASAACRTYPTNANVTTTVRNITQNATLSGTFNTGASQATIMIRFANGALCSTAVHTYNSVADFVDEVRVVPPLSLVRSTTTTNSGGCGSSSATVTSTYDGQRRLTQLSGPTGTTTYTAWDASGRPTTGTFPGGGSIANVYNDAARTVTQTQTAPNTPNTVTIMTFDANGAQTLVVATTGSVTSTTTFTNTATATVCK